MTTVASRVQDVVSDKLGVEKSEVVPSASFTEDLNADSLDLVELIMAFEEEFDIEITDEDAEKMRTVSDVVKYVSGTRTS